MNVVVVDDPRGVAEVGRNIFIEQIAENPNSVLGLATGSTPLDMYNGLIQAYQDGEISFKSITTFNLDEYLGFGENDYHSYRQFMSRSLFEHVDIRQTAIHIPNGRSKDIDQTCIHYEESIQRCGGIDLQLLGIGANGHIGFNEPTSPFDSRTRLIKLNKRTIEDNARFFCNAVCQPKHAITMGVGTIFEARKILLLATGSGKADAVKAAVDGPVSTNCPASVLRLHANAVFIVDRQAATKLS
jgi:glucosamine-6-phosphate deaminase